MTNGNQDTGPQQEGAQGAPAPAFPPTDGRGEGDRKTSTGRIEPPNGSAVTTIRVFATVMLIVTVVIQFVIGTFSGGLDMENTGQILSLVFGAGAIGVGMLGIWIKLSLEEAEEARFTFKDITLAASIACIVLSAAFGPFMSHEFIEAASIELSVLLSMLVQVLVFAVAFLWYIELAHATVRFDKMEQFVLTWNVKDFKIKDVGRSYFIGSAIIIPIVFGITFGVLALSKGIIALAPPLISSSIEFNSIYGIVAVTALIFVPVAIILNFIFGWEGYQKATRRIFAKEEEEEDEGVEEFA